MLEELHRGRSQSDPNKCPCKVEEEEAVEGVAGGEAEGVVALVGGRGGSTVESRVAKVSEGQRRPVKVREGQ